MLRGGGKTMYEKMLLNKEIIYFIYAPPMTELDKIKERNLPKKGLSSVSKWDRSVFYYWWLFLKENAEYRQTCKNNGSGPKRSLFRDFGDIYASNFDEWWKAGGRDLFREPESEGVRLQVAGGYEENRVNISIPMTGDLERSLSEIRALLQPVLLSNRIVAGPSKAMYPVASKPVLSSLDKIYSIYRVSKAEPEMRPWELFEHLKLSTAVQSKESQSSTISRALKQASFLIEHVGDGFFPVMNNAQLASAKSMLENRERLRMLPRHARDSSAVKQAAAERLSQEQARKSFFASSRSDQ